MIPKNISYFEQCFTKINLQTWHDSHQYLQFLLWCSAIMIRSYYWNCTIPIFHNRIVIVLALRSGALIFSTSIYLIWNNEFNNKVEGKLKIGLSKRACASVASIMKFVQLNFHTVYQTRNHFERFPWVLCQGVIKYIFDITQ